MVNIEVFKFPLSVNYNKLVRAALEPHPGLADYIKGKCDAEWLKDDLEVFIYNGNIAVREDGYLIAFYEGTRSYATLSAYLKSY